MARLPRLSLAGHPHHIVQRGNNSQPIFVDAQDRDTMLALLAAQARDHGVAVHAYVLMDNHFHVLATPRSADGIPKFMQAVGRSYVRYFNDRHQRRGTLWEGRYRATLLQAERYLLPCMVYLDLNPVRAALAGQARDYAWSSHGHYLGQRQDRWLTPPPQFWALGNTPFAREAAYADLVQAGLDSASQTALTETVLQGWALGDAAYVANLQTQTTRRLSKRAPGRPAKKNLTDNA